MAEEQNNENGTPVQADETGTAVAAARECLKTGRNDPCHCGSGKKYKKCCLAKDEALVLHAAEAARMQPPQPVAPPVGRVTPEESVEQAKQEVPDEFLQDAFTPDIDPIGDSALDLSSEDKKKLETVWKEFKALTTPSAAQMDQLVTDLLSLPPEASNWSDLFRLLLKHGYGDPASLFRRISGSVPHTKEAGISYFYWGAAEVFDQRPEFRNLLPEVAAAMQKLDLDSYDADALYHIEPYLLANGFDAELLQLCEYFLPIVLKDEGLMPHAAQELAISVLELRAGRALLGEADAGLSAERMAKQLLRGLEEEISPDVAEHLAAIITGHGPTEPLTQSDFDLVTGNVDKDDQAQRAAVRLNGTLLRVAQEAYQVEKVPPGCAFPRLEAALASVYNWIGKQKKKKGGRNLLAFLNPSGMEERMVQSCRDLIGVNVPQMRVLIQGHELLLHFASPHGLISQASATQTEHELARLSQELERVRS